MRIFHSLKARLVIGFGLTMLLIGTLTSAYLNHVLTDRLRTDKLHNLQGIAASVAALLSENLRERQREISLLAKSHDIQNDVADSRQLQGAFNQIQQSFPQYAWIGYADISGKVLASTNGLLVKSNVAARPWFIEGKKGPFIGDLHEALLLKQYLSPSADGEPPRFIDFAVPVLRPKG